MLSEMMDVARLKTLSPGVLFQSHTDRKGYREYESLCDYLFVFYRNSIFSND